MIREGLVRAVARNHAWLLFKARLARDPQKRALNLWLLENPSEEVRYNYPLTPRSVVFDVGGYQGEWTAEIVRRFDPYVHVFEPIPEFADQLAHKFATNDKVHVHAFGLGAADERQLMAQIADESSAFVQSDKSLSLPVRDVSAFVREMSVETIDLMKINIEGGEYPLLRRMIETGIVASCRDFQVQFHSFVPNAQQQYEEIRSVLLRTHALTYEYPFVWENWRRVGV